MLASAAYDSTIKLWDIQNAKESARLLALTRFVHNVAFSPGGLILASRTGFNGTIRFWDVQTKKELCSSKGFDGMGQSIAFPSDKYLAAVTPNGTLKVLSPKTGVVQSSMRVRRGDRPLIAFPSAGTSFFVNGEFRDLHTYKVVAVAKAFPGEAISAALSADGKVLAVAGSVEWQSRQRPDGLRAGLLKLYDARSGRELASYSWKNPSAASHFFSVAFSPEGRTIAVGTADFKVILLETARLLERPAAK
jgi:WD40 repeat protein